MGPRCEVHESYLVCLLPTCLLPVLTFSTSCGLLGMFYLYCLQWFAATSTTRTKSSIYQFHPEIPSRIAYHLPLKIYLICATHISSCFPDSLMSHPGVWAHVDFKNAERPLTFFEGLISAPLHINMSHHSPLLPAQTEPLRRNAMHIVTLELDAGPEEWELFLQPMPSLVKFEMTRDLPEGETERTLRSPPFITSLSAHDAHLSLLHTPHLVRFQFLCTGSTEDWSRQESLFEFLCRSPYPEELEISYGSEFPTPDDRYISLQNLRITQTCPHTPFLHCNAEEPDP